MNSQLPRSVKIVEVGPRDGLQNEKQPVNIETKLELIKRLVEAGLEHIEAGAFVSPKWVPQMADTGEIFKQLSSEGGVNYSALVPNQRGMEAAIECGVKEVAVFAAASETFSQKNINCSISESLTRFEPVFQLAEQHSIRVRGYVSTVVVCPYEGEIAPQAVARVADSLAQMGCYEISLGETIGAGTPLKVQKMIESVMKQVPVDRLAAHYHDTFGMAVANIFASLQMGISTIDSSIGGLGGCPYAPGAAGNVATETVVYLLNGLGISHGLDHQKLASIVPEVLPGLSLKSCRQA